MNIKSVYEKLKNWSNANQGLLTFLGLLISIYALVPFNKIDFKSAIPLLDKIMTILIYDVKIPLYLFVVVITISTFYFIRIKNRYTRKYFSLKELKGTWRNDWGENEGHELFTLNEKGNYVINGEHIFNLTEFNYNPKSNEITFYKDAVRQGDARRVFNSVKIINNELLAGTEQDYKIKYTKVSS
jgi:hypothetical protein